MLSSKYQRLYHYHLKKCGGTTLNSWLDMLTDAERRCHPARAGAWLLGDWRQEASPISVSEEIAVGHSLFHWSDVVHSHAVLRPFAPEGTLCFTVLRDPIQRLLSQVADWARLVPQDTAEEPPAIRDMIAAIHHQPLAAFLDRYGRGDGRVPIDNYLTRALAANRLGRQVMLAEDCGTLLDAALQSLETDFDVVLLTEDLDIGRNALCGVLGLPPLRSIDHLNRSRLSSAYDPEAAAALQEFTRFDQVVYERACALFDRRHRLLGETYDHSTFERQYASDLLRHLQGNHDRGATRFSVRRRLAASGLHGRDSPDDDLCAVWTGPATTSTLYLPVPPHMQLSLLLWIRGYAAERQRDQIRIRVDGRPAVHRFAPIDHYADLLMVDACSERDFIRLEIEIDETLTSGEADVGPFDERKRGIAFDAYGWRVLRPYVAVSDWSPPQSRRPPATSTIKAVA